MEVHQIAQLLNQTFSPDGNVVHAATDALDRLSSSPDFPFSLLSVVSGGENEGQKIAAAAYLKNLSRRNIHSTGPTSRVSKEFRDALIRVLLRAEDAVLKVLVEAFRVIVVAEFVKEHSWPELVPELRSVIHNSDLISGNEKAEWKTINALTVIQSLIRPFQYFLNPKIAKEPVPLQLELIAEEILSPLFNVFHQCVEQATSIQGTEEVKTERVILIVCKCIYLAVRSHMPSALTPVLPSLCRDLIRILNSLSFDGGETLEDRYLFRLKAGKRSLLIFCALVARHRKFSDKLMPDIVDCVFGIIKHAPKISKLDFLSERVVSLAFDVISHVLETGPGWRLISPQFSSLLDSAIFPALVMNEKDIVEWEEDADEYIRKNLPSDLEEISGWRDDLFTARKSALNLLGVISMSKGPRVSSVSSKRKKGEKNKWKDHRSMGELLVLPFLSKFPIPADFSTSQTKPIKDYYGVLLAYGSLVDFMRDQKPGYVAAFMQTRVLPLYKESAIQPYLLATANWVLGELASCIPEDLSADVFSSLLKSLAMLDKEEISCYPVRVSAAGAIAQLVENDYFPKDWLLLLQVVISRIGDEDEETTILFELLRTLVETGSEAVAPHIPDIAPVLVGTILKYILPHSEPWSQIVEHGFATLAVMAQCWDDAVAEEAEQNNSDDMLTCGQSTIARAFSDLLQQAWVASRLPMEGEVDPSPPPPSCAENSSTLLRFIIKFVIDNSAVPELRISELLLVWANLIADWHEWEEREDLSIFNCIKEVINLHQKFAPKNFFVGERSSSPLAPSLLQHSIIEGIGAFVSEAFSQYPSAIWRASSCVHLLLHVLTYSSEADNIKQGLVIAFTQAAFSRFRDIKSEPSSLWKPLLLSISSCYLSYPDIVEKVLVKDDHKGFTVWASALVYILSSESEYGLSAESEIKLSVLTLVNVVEKLLQNPNENSAMLRDCFGSLMEAAVRLKEVKEEEEEEDDDDEDEEEDEEETEDDEEDSDADEPEETEEEFLERYADAATKLENGMVLEEGDVEDQEQEIELGGLQEVDEQSTIRSLLDRYHQVFLQLSLSPQTVFKFSNAFPECSFYFQHHSN